MVILTIKELKLRSTKVPLNIVPSGSTIPGSSEMPNLLIFFVVLHLLLCPPHISHPHQGCPTTARPIIKCAIILRSMFFRGAGKIKWCKCMYVPFNWHNLQSVPECWTARLIIEQASEFARNRVNEEYKSTVKPRTCVLLIPFQNCDYHGKWIDR